MRKIPKPNLVADEVFLTCTSAIADVELKSKLEQLSASIENNAFEYENKAKIADLYTIPPILKTDKFVTQNVTKEELEDLYTKQMVPQSKPARKIYDELRSSAPYNKCPFCGFGQVNTLDHYLPKAKYPLYSVFPENLIPSCSVCNHGKSTSSAQSKEEQCLHTYFEELFFFQDQWIFAKLEEEKVEYYVDPPNCWDKISVKRATKHFEEFGLAERYSIEAGEELANIKDIVPRLFEDNFQAIKEYLIECANSSYSRHPNSWKTSLYQALAQSDWYCKGGYNTIVETNSFVAGIV